METRTLGRTGHRSSVAILGGAAFWDAPEKSRESFTAAMAAGVNHLDVAPQYGRAEEVLGPLVGEARDRLFVACKTQRRDPGGVRAQLEESLTRLHCESFDLYQLHAVTDLAELDARAGGADTSYRHDAEALLEEASSRNLGVMAIKAGAARPWGERDHTATTWYEPYVTDADLQRNIRFVLSVPGVQAFCTPGDLGLLPKVLRVAGAAAQLDDEEMREAMSETAAEEHIFPMPAMG
jgi:hypothetical protein